MNPPPPAANPLLLGHRHAEARLVRAWTAGRLPHAWLLRGPRGVGKATLAYRLARHLLAGKEHEQAAADPAHPVFRMVANNAHPDLQLLRLEPDAKGRTRKEIPVDAVRAADAALHATTAGGGARLLLVDAVDDLNRSGTNALLKLLEEPPAGVVLLLVCQRPGMVPRTILSRCAQLALPPLPRDAVLQGLARLAPDLPPERAEVLATLAEGSIGRALELEATDWLALYAEWLQRLAVARESEAGRLACALQLAQDTERLGFRGTAELLGTILRRLTRLQAGQAPASELFEGETAALAALAAGRGLDHWITLWDKLRASGLRVEALNLDPLQALVPLVHALCGGRAEPEFGSL